MNENLIEIEFRFRNQKGYVFGLPAEFQSIPITTYRTSNSVMSRFLSKFADLMISSGYSLKKGLAEPSIKNHSVA